MGNYSPSIQDLAHGDVVECSLTSSISSDAGWSVESRLQLQYHDVLHFYLRCVSYLDDH